MTLITPTLAKVVYGIKDDAFALEVAEAVNCPFAGQPMHSQCGVCEEHHVSFKVCGCHVRDGQRFARNTPGGFQTFGART